MLRREVNIIIESSTGSDVASPSHYYDHKLQGQPMWPTPCLIRRQDTINIFYTYYNTIQLSLLLLQPSLIPLIPSKKNKNKKRIKTKKKKNKKDKNKTKTKKVHVVARLLKHCYKLVLVCVCVCVCVCNV